MMTEKVYEFVSFLEICSGKISIILVLRLIGLLDSQKKAFFIVSSHTLATGKLTIGR